MAQSKEKRDLTLVLHTSCIRHCAVNFVYTPSFNPQFWQVGVIITLSPMLCELRAQTSQKTFPHNVAIQSQGRNVSSGWPDSKSAPFPPYPSATDGEKHRWCPSCNSPAFQSPYGKIRIAMETSLDSSSATPPIPSLPPVSPFFMVMVPGIP